MKVTIKIFGLPELFKILGASYNLDFAGDTLKELIEHLISLHSDQLRPILLDENNRLDSSIQVLINNKEFVRKKEYSSFNLREGDTVMLMLLAAGG